MYIWSFIKNVLGYMVNQGAIKANPNKIYVDLKMASLNMINNV